MSPQPFVIIWVWATRMPVTGNSPNSVKCHQARGRCTATITLSSFCAVKATIALPGASHREPKRRNRGIYRNEEKFSPHLLVPRPDYRRSLNDLLGLGRLRRRLKLARIGDVIAAGVSTNSAQIFLESHPLGQGAVC